MCGHDGCPPLPAPDVLVLALAVVSLAPAPVPPVFVAVTVEAALVPSSVPPAPVDVDDGDVVAASPVSASAALLFPSEEPQPKHKASAASEHAPHVLPIASRLACLVVASYFAR